MEGKEFMIMQEMATYDRKIAETQLSFFPFCDGKEDARLQGENMRSRGTNVPFEGLQKPCGVFSK